MENKNLTALEWLEEKLKSLYTLEGRLPLGYTLSLLKEAKEMDRKEKIYITNLLEAIIEKIEKFRINS